MRREVFTSRRQIPAESPPGRTIFGLRFWVHHGAFMISVSALNRQDAFPATAQVAVAEGHLPVWESPFQDPVEATTK